MRLITIDNLKRKIYKIAGCIRCIREHKSIIQRVLILQSFDEYFNVSSVCTTLLHRIEIQFKMALSYAFFICIRLFTGNNFVD